MMINRILESNDDVERELNREVVDTASEMMMYGLNGTLAKAT
jgi:hypothetical protein